MSKDVIALDRQSWGHRGVKFSVVLCLRGAEQGLQGL